MAIALHRQHYDSTPPATQHHQRLNTFDLRKHGIDMTTPIYQANSLRAAILKKLLISSFLLPQLMLATSGCQGLDDETSAEEAADPGEAGNCKGDEATVFSVLLHAPAKQGLVQSAATAAGVQFTAENYESVIINVEGETAASLVPVVNSFLDGGKQVVLDSNGGLTDRATIGEITAEVAGMKADEASLSIVRPAPGAFTVTPIIVGSDDGGNTPLAVLRMVSARAAGCASAEPQAVVAPSAAATDTITIRTFQGRGQPEPATVRTYIDNNATYGQTSSSGSLLKRYIWRGNPQRCPTGGTINCTMTWGEEYSKSIAHGTSVTVDFGAQLTKVLTGRVEIGYSLTLTKSYTLAWSNAVNIKRGWSARPVSYLTRKRGAGSVKNAYVFQDRKKIASPCRPIGGCYQVTDTYVRQPNTSVGTWSANVALNQGSPTNSWNTYNGSIDPTVYVFD
jgi:hypothetical protein